jgi:glutathione synthase/RimK-type ligase-like ATP-grasp enzyme
MNILILGNSEELHITHVQKALTQAGVKVEYLNTSEFITGMNLSWQPDTQQGYLSLANGYRFNLQDIHSVFWHSFGNIPMPSFQDTAYHAIYNAMSTLRSVMQGASIRWINSWQAYQFHQEKPLQLKRIKEIGVKIPSTLISNDPQAILEFVKSHEKLTFKPVYGSSCTRPITETYFDRDRLSLALCFSPVKIQEYNPGTNIRVYVIGESIYSAEICSPSLDIVDSREAQIIPIELPQTIQHQCRAIAKAFSLEWAAIDWRLNMRGEYIFLEANPSPKFLDFEYQTGFPITQTLVNLLMNG